MWRQIRLAIVFLFLATSLFAQNVQRSELSLNVMNYGAMPDDGVDDTAGFRAAVLAVPIPYGARIYVPRGRYEINDTVTVNKDRVHFEGDGVWATYIAYTPIGPDRPVFDYNRGPGNGNVQSSLRRMSFISGDSTTKKIAVRLTDVSGFVLEDIAVLGDNGGWRGSDSIGVQVRGRDLSRIGRADIRADMPIKVEHNANYTGAGEDLDVWHFYDLTLAAANDRYCITIDDGAMPGDFVLDGANSFTGGHGGLYWNDTTTTPPGVTYRIKISGVRAEQMTPGADPGWIVYINSARKARHVTLDHVGGGGGESVKGYFFRGVRYLTLLNTQYTGLSDGVGTNNAVALQLEETNSANLINCFWQATTLRNMTNMRRLFAAVQGYESEYQVYTNEYWENEINTNLMSGRTMQVGGGTPGATGPFMVGGSGTLANGADVPLQSGFGAAKAIYIQVFTYGTSGRSEGGTAFLTSTTELALNGTSGFFVTPGANRIAIDKTGGWANIKLRNTTGVEMNYAYTLWWF